MTVRKSIYSGVFFTAITKYSGIVISIIIGAILARLLSPEEFGTVALVTVFIAFFNILSDVGIGPAVIQNKDLTKKDIESIFFFSILLGFVLAAIFFFSSQIIASFYKNLELIPIIKLLSLTVLFSSFRIVPNALLLKNLQFKKVGIVMVSVQLLSGLFAIYFAYKGFSYYALVYKSIFDSFFTFALFYFLSPISLKFGIKKAAIKKIFRFSAFQFSFNFINYFSRNADNLLIGKYISPTALGFYDKSYQLMLLPVHNLTHVITPVLHPVLSEFQNDTLRIYNAYLKVIKLLAFIGFPLSVFLYFSAHEIIFILFGSQWGNSVPVFKLLALTIGVQMVLSSSGSIFQAVNRTDLLFYSGVLSAICMVSGICFGIFVGESTIFVAYGLIVAFIINFIQGFYMLIKMALHANFFNFLKVFIVPLSTAFFIAIALWFVSEWDLGNYVFKISINFLISLIIFFASVMTKKEYRILLKNQYIKLKNKK